MPIGVHTSIAGGLSLAVDRAKALKCGAVQIFSRNPRSWLYAPIDRNEARLFREKRVMAGILSVAVHTTYLINLSSPDDAIYRRSIDLFKHEISNAESIGADFIVTHLGSPKGRGEAFAKARILLALKEAQKAGLGGKAAILLENTAGGGDSFGSRISGIGEVIGAARGFGFDIGLCFDTCHAFAAGYGFDDAGALLDRVEKEAGPGSLRLIHLNDSKGGFSSRLDRHEHIGKGDIGSRALKAFINDRRALSIPLILETPKRDEADDRRNLMAVRRMRAAAVGRKKM